ncbi:DNA packaging tegument protein UL25 [macacine betaherpesvirus 9]|uniref:DNA packaging tegument protein UL25 n=1 Tax=macacine betaherpesvirus 9 TaxID=2560568 RepID=A0A192XNR5_9BETA|nr:DNA packaging tegument protein UL25 [macacine betaherpesvirus 9]ANC96536.1 DNA packaging tegument protein UL25 [macacine betaherpesvirus 9]
MTQLNLFYQFPIQPIFEGHVKNILICKEEEIQKLQQTGAITLRKKKEEIQKSKILKTQLKSELETLQLQVQTECQKFDSNLKNIEDALLTNNQIQVSQSANVPSETVTSQHTVPKQVTITQIDPAIHFTDNFRNEMIETFYNNSHMWNYTFGSWFYKMKRIFFNDQKIKRMLKLTYIDSLSISKELLSVVISAMEQITVYPMYDNHVSDFEAGLCLLAAYFSTYNDCSLSEKSTLIDVVHNLSFIFRHLNTEIISQKNISDLNFYFGFKDPNNMKFFIPLCKGRHYAVNTFAEHILVKILITKNIIRILPGEKICTGGILVESQLTGALSNDKLLYWTQILLRPKLGKDIPIFVHEQQYLRSGIVAIESLFLLWQVLNSESIFIKRTGKFYLTTLFPHVSKNDFSENNFASGNIQNFEFLMRNYVIPTYILNTDITISGLFPGLIGIIVNESVRLGWNHQKKNTQENILHSQTKENPFATYIRSQLEESSELIILEKHDDILFHFEHGLNVTLSLALPRHRLFAMASSLFNVSDIYDFLYFIVLGFVPIAAVM